jgi:hypothetical protein
MSITSEAAPEVRQGHWGVTDRYRNTPRVGSWNDAVALIDYLLEEIGTYPEKVTPCNLDGIPPGRLAGPQPPGLGELRDQPGGQLARCTLTRGQSLKARAVWEQVSACLTVMNAWARIPVEMALRFDSGAVTPMWGDYVLQLLPDGEAPE